MAAARSITRRVVEHDADEPCAGAIEGPELEGGAAPGGRRLGLESRAANQRRARREDAQEGDKSDQWPNHRPESTPVGRQRLRGPRHSRARVALPGPRGLPASARRWQARPRPPSRHLTLPGVPVAPTDDEADLIAAQPALLDGRVLRPGRQAASQHLELLLQRELAVAAVATCRRPWPARSTGARHTSSCSSPARVSRSSGSQSGIVKVLTTIRVPGRRSRNFGVSCEGCPRGERATAPWPSKCRPRTCRLRRRSHGRRPPPRPPALRQHNEVGVELDAARPGAAPRRGDDVAAVARPEIDHEVRRRDLREVEHLLDERVGVGDPHDVLAGLTHLRLVRRWCLGRLRAGRLGWLGGLGKDSRHGKATRDDRQQRGSQQWHRRTPG